ncbi:hypothetical protein ONS95_006697 [Cadophora gregata]|uniref:uncharacterized protein n=1 Tax=Cadophora gregata TaxID=51156 RepID=UPI0026DC40D8|nr:uncharacterized protein ONS95_006697 [Cadophora gregata]KAK0101530.1 hypothetical protein ONS95_006697 [Cadophora gregata]KAK0106454.1 hypothetical protein ONS96_004084 [Cadophora gregata f. sp. sojae]
MDDTDESEVPVLSGSALSALKEFYAEREARKERFEDLKAEAGNNATSSLSMDAFAEDWNESQFWYSDETAKALAEELLVGAGPATSIAVVSAPSVFVQMKNILAASGTDEVQKPTLWLLEFDKRFEVFPEFVFYDFKNPMKLPRGMKASVDHIICDPPFLSEDCQTKAAMTVRWLSKSWGVSPDKRSIDSRLILCTGERMETLVNRLYRPQGIATTTFEPIHSKGLSNEFFCYTNFECDRWKWKGQDESKS